jgi:HlyD family secretion protein
MKIQIPKRICAAVIILLVLIGAAAYKLYLPETKGITATGTIEVTKADITPKVSGYIRGLDLDVGDAMKRGQVALKIDRPDLKAQLLRDEAALEKSKAQLRELENGSRSQELLEAEAAVQSAAAVYEKAQKDYDRYASLYDGGAVSAQQLDTVRSANEVAYRSLQTAQAKLSLAQEGNRSETIEAQRLEVERNNAILEATRTEDADTVVYCPADGLILTKNFEDGEYVAAGSPVATLGEMDDCWVKVYVASDQLGLIAVGQTVAVQVDSFPGRTFAGKIKEISQNAEYTPRQSITKRERANMVFAVKVKLDNSEGIFKPGMPADVVIS